MGLSACRAYADHYESDYTKTFLDQLDKMDVAYTLEILDHPDVKELVSCCCCCQGWRVMNVHFKVMNH